jgi:hypothetical protein
VVAEPRPRRRDVVDPGGVDQRISGDLTKRRRTLFRPQIGDILEAEIQDGLTPVTIAL